VEIDSIGGFELWIAIAASTAKSPFSLCATIYAVGDMIGHRVITVQMLLVTRLTMRFVIEESGRPDARSPIASCLTTTCTW
jgi:hypothetical protein